MCGICVFIRSKKCSEEEKQEKESHSDILQQVCKDLLSRRGPDASGNDQRWFNDKENNCKITIDVYGFVLHLRGSVTKQPLQDKSENMLLWNGEIFGGNLQVNDEENDGDKLLKRLSEVAENTVEADIEKEMVDILQGLHGPWSFVYWQNKLKQLWFGRDFFGRRSLLWHLPTSQDDVFALSSVVSKSPCLEFVEVPAKRVYCINGKDLLEFWTENSNVTSFKPCVTSYPICLPTSDFNHTMICQEETIIKQTLEEENNFLTECNCSHLEVNSSIKPNHMDTLNCCESNKVLCVNSTGNDCCGIDNAKSGIKCHCASCDHDIKDGYLRASNTRETLADTVSEKLCIAHKKENLSEEFKLNVECSSYCAQIMLDSEAKPKDLFCKECFFRNLQEFNENPPSPDNKLNIHLLEHYSSHFMEILEEATRRRVFNLPREWTNLDRKQTSHQDEACQSNLEGRNAKVGILFSGGIDSMVLAAMADRCIPKDEPIDLLNVAFEQKSRQQNKSRGRKNEVESVKDPYDVPDRETGKAGVKELNPDRTWNFIEVNVTLEETREARQQHVRHLVYPLDTVLDDSIGCAIWFAARGKGILYQMKNGELVKIADSCTSSVKVLLTGMGADEQLGGYARHRSKYEKFGWKGLEEEMQMEIGRISSRNLGRDDRCISDHGREARFPFLDENVASFLQNLPVWIKCDPRLPRGHGEKRLLREVARKLNLTGSAALPKRAIQFGSKIAKLENSKEKGGDSCNRLSNTKETT